MKTGASIRAGRARRRWPYTFRAAIAMMMAVSPAHAEVALPPLNLGDSGFQDGIAGPGLLFQQTLSAHHSHKARDERGERIDAAADVTAAALLVQVSYLSERTFLGAHVGAEAIVPLAHVAVEPREGPRLEKTAVGDLFLGPLLLQWPERTLFGRPFWQRANFNVTLPTGSYDRNAPLNIGTNAWQVNPHYAFTWVASPAWELSGRLHYLWVAPNRSPPLSSGARELQAGSAFHANASISRGIGDRVRAGASGYYLVQLVDDRVDGIRTGGRERVVGAGPALSWYGGSSSIHAAAYWEARARDRAEGVRVSLRLATVF